MKLSFLSVFIYRTMLFKLSLFLCLLSFACDAGLPEITAQDVTKKSNEIMKAHATYKKLTPILIQRILVNYIDNLDPNKTYFIEPEISQWLNGSDSLLTNVLNGYNKSQFEVFENIHEAFVVAINRQRILEKNIDEQTLPTNVRSEEFKETVWSNDIKELSNKLLRIRALQVEMLGKLNENKREKSTQWIRKKKTKMEDEILTTDPQYKQKLILSNILKATASALDTHTIYFTPGEANQFMIHVQQRLFGIGAQLRDDLSGLRVMKLVEGGPALEGKLLKEKDLIIAVNGEPIIGLDIEDAVGLIRGEANTKVILTVIRESTNPDGTLNQEKMEIPILRGEVVLKESRYKSSYEPYGNGAIGYLRLHSFYQDPDHSSASDLENEINKLKAEHRLMGLIVDLRYNSGGLLSQAVSVTGLFISKGIVVSIKDENGRIQHLRDLDSAIAWDGPLIILVNRLSASASEIVAQTLQDYGRAIVVGDDHTFGKGSYQTFTLSTQDDYDQVNPQGEYKVTRGRYYTVSGKTPQLTGVLSDIIVPGPLSESDVGERFAKYPLENDNIKSNYDDDLSDVPVLQRDKIRKLYKFGLQEKLEIYFPYKEMLKRNSTQRIMNNRNYQNFLKEIRKKDVSSEADIENFGQTDLQLEETFAIMKDLILMMKETGLLDTPEKQEEVFTLSHDDAKLAG